MKKIIEFPGAQSEAAPNKPNVAPDQFILSCTACNKSTCFGVELRSTNPNDIKVLRCAFCGTKTASGTIMISTMEKIMRGHEMLRNTSRKFWRAGFFFVIIIFFVREMGLL